MAESNETIAVGIDLGTTNSCVAIVENGKVTIIPDEHGRKTIPSMFTYTDDGKTLTGWDASIQAHMYPRNTVYEAKRLIGQNFDNEQIQTFMAQGAYEIINDANVIQIRLSDVEFYPEEISGKILATLKKNAEDYTRKTATKAVITVPAYFGDTQRDATKDAAYLAGFESVSTINEPTAAALAFQHNNPKDKKRNILIYDFGGGTFDVTVAKVEKNNCKVLATKGNCFLGGTDIDMNLVKYIKMNTAEQIHKNDARTLRRLKNFGEDAKKRLSLIQNYEIEIGSSSICITKDILDDVNRELFEKTINIAKQCVREARLNPKDIDEIVLIGGSSRIPKVQEMIKEAFGCHIAKTVNPEEAVAYGAALYASNMFGNTKEMNVKDVLSLSLGIEINFGQMLFVLKRNTPIPCEHIENIPVSSPKFMIRLYQGESQFVQHNHYLGQCIIDNAHRSTMISIKFSFDEDAILTISAESTTQSQLKIDMTKHKLSEHETKRLINYENYSDSDLKFMAKKQEFEFYCERLKKLLEKHHRRKKIMEKINTFKKKITKFSQNDIPKIDEFMVNMNNLYNKPKRKFF